MNRNDVLFDDISRVLASSIPRREALRLVAGGIGGVILSAVWPSRFAYALEGCGMPCDLQVDLCDPRYICRIIVKKPKPHGKCCDEPLCDTAAPHPDLCCSCEDRVCCQSKNKKKTRTSQCCDKKTECCKYNVDMTSKCCKKPAVSTTWWHGSPPLQVRMAFREAAEGMATVSIVKAVNVTVDIPPFVPGTTDPVVATLTKIDQTQPAHFALIGCSECGCCKTGDPVATTLKLNTGRWARQRFGNLGEAEYFVTVQNGHSGLHELTVEMNGKPFELRKLRDGERRDLNVSSAMVEGGHNVVILTGRGEVGASANIMISDTKVEPGPSAQIAAEIMGAHLGPGMERLRAHQNLVWGDLAEETEETTHLAFAESEGQTAQVTFGGRMDINSVSDLARYEVEVNGRPVRVEIVEPYVGSDSVTITLRLANRELRTGDKVSVFWDGLLNNAGYLVSGHVGPLVVRSLQ